MCHVETMMDSENDTDMESRLKAHSDYFTSMMELIPSKFYVIHDETEKESSGDEDESHRNSKFWVNKRSRAPKQAVKEATKRAKRLKFDPLSRDDSKGSVEEGASNENGAREGSMMTEAEEMETMKEKDGNGRSKHGGASRKRPLEATLNGFSVEHVQSGNLNDLRERLHSKIAELRGNRKLKANEDEMEGEKSGITSGKRHQRVTEKRQRKKETRKRDRERKQLVTKQHIGQNKDDGVVKRASMKDESGRVVFSKFDFSTSAAHAEPKPPKTKDFKKLLAKAEAAQKKLEKLRETDEKKSKELQEQLQWQRAMELAKGTKLKDNAKRLKKTVKRLEGKKSKSRKQWQEREKQETLAKEKRQEKRKKNIQERIEQVKAKKLKKRGKSRKPGF